MKVDPASLQSVRDLVASFRKRTPPLNILVNNAGVVPEGRTVDGFEQHFIVNYLGHFLLTWLLLDTLKNCGFFSRVVSVSSSAHHIGEFRLNDRNNCEYFSAHAAYRNSKLAQLLFSSYLHQELQKKGFSVRRSWNGGYSSPMRAPLAATENHCSPAFQGCDETNIMDRSNNDKQHRKSGASC